MIAPTTTSKTRADVTTPFARILVIEDDVDTRYGMQLCLTAAGYEVFLDDRGDNAVANAQKLKPDLVLLDLGLAGMDGLDVLDTMMKVMPKARVAVVSARPEKVFEAVALEAGAMLYLEKPVMGDTLVNAVRELLK